MNLLDLVLIALTVMFAISGYRQGFAVGALSFIGFLGGGFLGAKIASPFAELIGRADDGALVGLIVVVGLALTGQIIGTALGTVVRGRLTWRAGQRVDAVAGAALSGVSVLLVGWLLATTVDRSPFQTLARAARGSEILGAVDAQMPDDVRHTFSDLRQLMDDQGFPEVFAGLNGERIVATDPPDAAVVNATEVQNAASSILKIRGQAPSCGKQVEGTGFVFTPQHVMTNAHVVAGVSEVVVEVGAQSLPAEVVEFDPDRDVAVLYVPDLRRAPLRFQASPPGEAGDPVVVAGYPQDGPYTTEPARIRNEQTASAPDIYSRGTVRREIFAIRGQVLPGNSGGPLLSDTGAVLGVVFAAATDDDDTGYVLTAQEVSVPAQRGAQATAPVSTQGCD
ncbi:MarP family serine protease [Parafrankia sp. EUN1f]|uniref:MarP family serine protease n=1 Tax=Parafrankia sp. EUN1f TaxID=102897 RepID=UPI0001C44A66|nr:MarP family serine protease [Parafrankia sp. EUN1f]EFC84477.1 peptidase S1 and S6 chymotrypsin/Hap [Parafrankia sp. EUN1f]